MRVHISPYWLSERNTGQQRPEKYKMARTKQGREMSLVRKEDDILDLWLVRQKPDKFES